MSSSSLNILRKYFYDPLDHLMGAGLTQATGTQRFYQDGRVITELEQDRQTTIFRHQAQPLAQQQRSGVVADAALLMTDLAQTIIQASTSGDTSTFALTVYGFHQRSNGFTPLVGFNGECPDFCTGHFPLGEGNRFYNPVLMRFNSPDTLSPFSLGGANAYAYCENDPINFSDPTGNMLRSNAGRRASSSPKLTTPKTSTASRNTVTEAPSTSTQETQSTALNPDRERLPEWYPDDKNPLYFFGELLPTKIFDNKSTTPTKLTKYRRTYAIKGQIFDNFIAKNPRYQVVATEKKIYNYYRLTAEIAKILEQQIIITEQNKFANTQKLKNETYNLKLQRTRLGLSIKGYNVKIMEKIRKG